MTVKSFLYWLLGQKSGRITIAVWNWLWGLPIQSGGKIAVEVAQESLQSMQQSVLKLTESVTTLVAAFQQAKQKYEHKQQELQRAEYQAKIAHRSGNDEAARLAMTQVILIEKLLPQMAERVAESEKVAIAAKEKLQREREKLEAYKFQMQNLKDLAEVNEALAAVAKVSNGLDIADASSQFAAAQSAVEQQYLKQEVRTELAENPAEILQTELDKLALNDEIHRRLHALDAAK